MVLCQYSRDWLYKKAVDIYSRRGAENAKIDEYNDTLLSLQKIHVTSAPLGENMMLNQQHRQVYHPCENLQQQSDQVGTSAPLSVFICVHLWTHIHVCRVFLFRTFFLLVFLRAVLRFLLVLLLLLAGRAGFPRLLSSVSREIFNCWPATQTYFKILKISLGIPSGKSTRL